MSTNPDINITLGSRLKKIRTQKKITREELAEKIDVSSRFLADVEIGKVGISLSTLNNLCKALNVSSDYLIGIKNDETTHEYNEINNFIARIDKKYLPHLLKIISAFYDLTDEM